MARRRHPKFIQKTGISEHKGALHRALGIPEGTVISPARLRQAAKRPGHVGHMARFAMILRKLPHHHGPLGHRRKRRARHSSSR